MTLKFICSHCKKESKLKASALTRRELSDKLGFHFKANCSQCRFQSTYGVNQVFAKASIWPKLITFIIGMAFIIGSIIYSYSSEMSILWGISIGALIITSGFMSEIGSNSRAFNKWRV